MLPECRLHAVGKQQAARQWLLLAAFRKVPVLTGQKTRETAEGVLVPSMSAELKHMSVHSIIRYMAE